MLHRINTQPCFSGFVELMVDDRHSLSARVFGGVGNEAQACCLSAPYTKPWMRNIVPKRK